MKARLEKKVRILKEDDDDLRRPKYLYGEVPVEDILDELNGKYYDLQFTAEDIGTNIFYVGGVDNISDKDDINTDFKICVGCWACDHGYFPKLKKLSKTDVAKALESFKSDYIEYIMDFDVSEVNWFGNISFYKYLEMLANEYDTYYMIAIINGHFFIAPIYNPD